MLKDILNLICFILTLPLAVASNFLVSIFNERRVYPFFSQLVSIIPGIPGEFIRSAFYKQTLKNCGNNCCISFGTIFSTSKASLGNNVYIGPYCILGEVSIGNDTLLASRVSITSGKQQHGTEQIDIPIRDQDGHFDNIVIGQNCWLGEGAIICATVGENSIVGAGSVVLNIIESNIIVTGNPAILKRKR